MLRNKRLVTAVALLSIASGSGPVSGNTVTAVQGGVARWSGGAASECAIFGRRYPAIEGVCYYPVDMKSKPGVHEIAMWDGAGARTLGKLIVTRRECARTEITPEGDAYAKVSDANSKRGAEERARIKEAVAGAPAKAGFTLPLGAPAEGIATLSRNDFCELRIYNGGKVKSRHTGIDFPLPRGTEVVAGASGKVVLAEDQFFTGKTVIVDHGGGLATMAFHLDEIAVKPGSMVRRGAPIGTVGSSGRSSGPHLHYGARYQNQRIDAGVLIGELALLPDVAQAPLAASQVSGAAGTDGVLPGSEDATATGDQANQPSPAEAAIATDGQPTDQTGAEIEIEVDGEAEPAEDKDEVLRKEAEEQRRADEAAKKR